ncbi:MAG: diphthine synthase [Candidatus Thalassarchaeaceae archaeon]|nr:diphthine synthase [Candidatus Thalassarchaeaceae archaeon]
MTAGTPSPGLWLVGLGPGDLEHMTDRAKTVARSCKKRYLEGYTAVLPREQEEAMEEILGPWERLMRPSVENPDSLLEEASDAPIALLVVGDPMQATTHIDLEARCAELGVGFEVVPGMSATSLAVSLSGLQSYRFGRQVTLPYTYGDYLAISPLEMIDANFIRGLHTLVLLDLDPTGMGFDPPRPMQPDEAVTIIERMVDRFTQENGMKESLEVPVTNWDGILLSDIGTDSQRVVSGTLGELARVGGGWIHTLILPANMSDNELGAYGRRRQT